MDATAVAAAPEEPQGPELAKVAAAEIASAPPGVPPRAAAAASKPVSGASRLSDPAVLTKIAEKLVPGTHPEGDLSTLKGVGQCEGVIYLGAGIKYVDLPDGDVHAAVLPSYERQALQYLRAMSKMWHARHFLLDGTRRVGVSKPSIDFLITPEMRALAAKEERTVEWLFTCDPQCINAVQPAHRGRWVVFPVTHLMPEGIWAIVYV